VASAFSSAATAVEGRSGVSDRFMLGKCDEIKLETSWKQSKPVAVSRFAGGWAQSIAIYPRRHTSLKQQPGSISHHILRNAA
jgi:hypothetical protein